MMDIGRSEKTVRSLHFFVFGITMLTFVVTCITIMMVHNLSYRHDRSDGSLVHWRPSLYDDSISSLWQGSEESENSYRPLVFLTNRFVGSEYFSQAIKSGIALQETQVHIFDLRKAGVLKTTSDSKYYQQRLAAILPKRSKKKLVFIQGNIAMISAIGSAVQKTSQLPYMIVLLRDPVEMLLSNYHQKLYGTPLYRQDDNMTSEMFRERVADLILHFERCVGRNQNCAKNLLGANTILKSVSGFSQPKSKKLQEWAIKALRMAIHNVRTKRSVLVGVMEDFNDLPYMFEQVAPKICKNLGWIIKRFNTPVWAHESAVTTSNETRDILMKNNPLLEFEDKFYQWVKAHYFKLKSNSFQGYIQNFKESIS